MRAPSVIGSAGERLLQSLPTPTRYGLSRPFTLAANHAGDVADGVHRGIDLARPDRCRSGRPGRARPASKRRLWRYDRPARSRGSSSNGSPHRQEHCVRRRGLRAGRSGPGDLPRASWYGLPAGSKPPPRPFGRAWIRGAGAALLGLIRTRPSSLRRRRSLSRLLMTSARLCRPTAEHMCARSGPGSELVRTPRTSTDSLTNLAAVSDDATVGAGNIQVQIITGTDAAGRTRAQVFVYLPGTDDFDVVRRFRRQEWRGRCDRHRRQGTAYEQACPRRNAAPG